MKLVNYITLFIILLCSFQSYAGQSDSLQVSEQVDEAQLILMYQQYLDSIAGQLTYEEGLVNLKNNLASIAVPTAFKFLNAKDSEMVLTEIWGNPPSESEEEMSLGMLFPSSSSPLTDSSFAINITYTEDGFIDDADALDIDYSEMLATMKEDAEATNQARMEAGYPTVEMVGWASPPFYDAENKKLHWAKELKFGDSETNTLNYNIRILGRRGYLQLNVIGEMYVLDQVLDEINPIIQSVNFNEGNKYTDFDPKIDKVAAYGIGALITGKVLAKAGILAKVGILLAKFWKIIVIGLIAFGAGIKNFFSKKKKDNSPAEPEA